MASPGIEHQIYSEATPLVNSLSVIGKTFDVGGGWTQYTMLQIIDDVLINSNIIIENVVIAGDNRVDLQTTPVLYIGNYSLTTRGSLCKFTVSIIGNRSDTNGTSEIVVTGSTEFLRLIEVYKLSGSSGYCRLRGGAYIDNVVRYVTIEGNADRVSSEIGHLYNTDGCGIKNAVVYIKKISGALEDSLHITFTFGKIEEFGELTIGEINCPVQLSLHGSISYTITDMWGNEVGSRIESASPFNVTKPIAVLDNPSDFDDVQIYFWEQSAYFTHYYSISDDGEIVLKEFEMRNDFLIYDNCVMGYKGEATEIEIPEGIISIADNAFAGNNHIESVIIPNSVVSVGERAFAQCYNLTNVIIGYGVTEIGFAAFASCTSLTSITIPGNVITIGNEAFIYCTSLTSLLIHDGVTSIGDSAFAWCENIESVTIPNSVTSFGSCAFDLCYNIITANIPVTAMPCVNIGKVENLVINGGTSISDSKFRWQQNLKNVRISNSIVSIGDFSFGDCNNLTSITFDGTKAEWNAISKGYKWNYNVPATEVVCSDGTVSLK